MSVFSMSDLEIFLGEIEEFGTSVLNETKIEWLEGVVVDCNRANFREEEQLVPDSIYDRLVEVLREVSPDASVLSELWEDEGTEADASEYDYYLHHFPMLSILTVKSWAAPELTKFIQSLGRLQSPPLFFSYKINGHGVRVVYKDGELVKATSRARASAGRDLTRQMRNILGDHNSGLAGWGMVEVRGEVALPTDRLEAAREFNSEIKSAFTAVSSLIKPSSTLEENSLLEFFAYGMYFENRENVFSSKEEEYGTLDSCGFSTPVYFVTDEDYTQASAEGMLKSIVEEAEEAYNDTGLYCDGIVVQINDMDTFSAASIEGKYSTGNVALKVGVWEQNLYAGVVQTVVWTRGKSKRSPVAIVSENADEAEIDETKGFGINSVTNVDSLGVLTAAGNRVRRVPLYVPKNVLVLEAYPGNIIHFRYGGEAGVVPCYPDGRLLMEDALRDLTTA